jgi:hypothetical protein
MILEYQINAGKKLDRIAQDWLNLDVIVVPGCLE